MPLTWHSGTLFLTIHSDIMPTPQQAAIALAVKPAAIIGYANQYYHTAAASAAAAALQLAPPTPTRWTTGAGADGRPCLAARVLSQMLCGTDCGALPRHGAAPLKLARHVVTVGMYEY